MAEYIMKDQAVEWFRPYGHMNEGIPFSTLKTDVMGMPAADVAPVVRCRDCEHMEEMIGGPICTFGICVDCVVPEEFYCGYGKRKDGGAREREERSR